ncbi:hypothetical protein EMA8858_01661 [Emticicia aquatica]|uniref:Bacterial surface antigen (D15) domain-containing protein n=1 Tax=Emticicia aquatica TaxID=1681835 RepID=A0ABM9AQJ6_9BACT|nr:hypothetical protein [Emticicia aquatica]CAH0995538.1 hypothetical protein EMA8858_01661 [Emticicia aquatica]
MFNSFRIVFFVCLMKQAFSQKIDTNKTVLMDVVDIWHIVKNKNYKADTSKAAVGVPLLTILPGFGYSQLTGFTILVDGNISFYTHTKTNISVIKITPEYTQNKQFTPILTSSIWSKNNRYNFVSDWRFYHYSLKDFGLGGFTSENIFNNYTYNSLRFHQLLSRSITSDLLLGIGYNFDKHFKVENIDSHLLTNADDYGVSRSTVSSGIVLNALYDSRRNENSPIASGWYGNFSFVKNMKVLKSSTNYNTIYADFRHYISFPRNSKNILAFWNLNWLTFGGKSPYFDLPSTLWDTYDNAGRTFIQGRFRGRNMLYFEMEYRFNILKNELLGGALFVNTQSFTEPVTYKFSKLLTGYGGSLRIKVNKKSNVYFVVSYGAGSGGTKGFFFNLGEVF